ncbi:hydroxymethylbilane synthase [Crocinitomicaceae bacterium]|nr:hydroxymethylbilane synthase [Crocinitomicaceae bacterium]
MQKVIIGSRGSDLALWQANHVKKQLEDLGNEVEIKVIITQGDALQDLSFDKLEGKGFFTKEIENELLAGTIDLAVHSHKDLETNPPAGLKIAAVSERGNPADILLIRKESFDASELWNLKENGTIGTSSARRKSLVKAFRKDCDIKDLRGNVPTRIDKLAQGQYDAIILAKAGVDRLKLDLSAFEVHVMDTSQFVPAPAQGVLGLQIREDDERMVGIMAPMHNKEVFNRIRIERKILNLLEGGCQLPLGVYCDESNGIFVSYSKSAEHPAQVLEFENTAFDIAEQIVAQLKNI